MQIITNQFQKELKNHGNFSFPLLISYEKLSMYESGSFLWHWHPEMELTFVLEGEMIYKINNYTFHLKTGDVILGNVNTLHAGFTYENMDCYYVAITFDPKIIYGFQSSLIYQKYIEPITKDLSLSAIYLDCSKEWHYQIINQIKEILNLEKKKRNTYELEMIIHLQTIWNLLFQHIEKETTPSLSAYEKKDYERIKKILTYIEKNYAQKITLQDISAHIHLCTSECSRLFKRYMRLSLFSFLQKYRIEKSLDYLFLPDYSITDVASKVGFNDSNYYSKIFTKYKGCSPRDYRKKGTTPYS